MVLFTLSAAARPSDRLTAGCTAAASRLTSSTVRVPAVFPRGTRACWARMGGRRWDELLGDSIDEVENKGHASAPSSSCDGETLLLLALIIL